MPNFPIHRSTPTISTTTCLGALGTFFLLTLASPFRAEADSGRATDSHVSHAASCPMTSSAAATTAEHDHGEALPREPGARIPEQIGQDAFGALAEVRQILETDAATDWSRADLDALREHLVDMNRVVLFAELEKRLIPGGFEARLGGDERTLEAIHRMVPAHARYVGHTEPAWRIEIEERASPDGALVLRITAEHPDRIDRLRGLGFFGFLTTGDHHRPHHRAMASGSGHP